jgi:hypothetical protein
VGVRLLFPFVPRQRVFTTHGRPERPDAGDPPQGLGLQGLPGGRSDVPVSAPERALLELLSDVGKTISLEEARQLTELVRSPRQKLLDALLTRTTRIKVVRLAALLASELELPWAALARRHSARLGGGERWVAVSRSGERLDLKRS